MIRLTGSLCELATLPTLFFYLMVMTSSRRIINDFNMKCVPLKHFFFFVMGFSTVASFTGMEAYIRATESTAIFFTDTRWNKYFVFAPNGKLFFGFDTWNKT